MKKILHALVVFSAVQTACLPLPCFGHDWFSAKTTPAGTVPLGAEGTLPIGSEAKPGGTMLPPTAAADRLLQYTTRTATSVDVPKAIPDADSRGATSALAANLTGAEVLTISLNIQHAYRSDLVVELVAPTGQRVTIFNRSTSGANLVINALPVQFPAGTSLNGIWTLFMRDAAALDAGSLQSWSLSASIPSHALLDLVISLKSNPRGDDNGNSQTSASGVNSDDQNRWERIIGHFADGVYEATEGAHRIRNVRIYRNGRNWSKADVLWDVSGHPKATGINLHGHVFMFETFTGFYAGKSDLDLSRNEVAGGYVLAHEWGHYYYGVRDEYARETSDIPVEPSIMNQSLVASSDPAIGGRGDLSWLNFSIKRTGNGGPFQNTLRTNQHRGYGASCWEVLSRPASDDPVDSASMQARSQLGRRNFYPELAAAAPTGVPRIDLPSSAARANLNIIWMAEPLTIEIVIDRSGSMSDSGKMAAARAAAALLVDAAELGKTRLGVTAFDTSVSNISPLRDLNTDADKAAVKTAINAITANGGTAIGDAAQAALQKITAGGSVGDTRVVFLLTDGQNTNGRDPLSVLPGYTQAQVPLFTFGFGSDADGTTLLRMATQTGGRYFFAPSTLAEITAAIRAASLFATSNPGLQSEQFSVAAGATNNAPVVVDSALGRLQVGVTYNATVGGAQVQLVAPNGTVINPTTVSAANSETLVFFDVAQPASGNWRLAATAVGAARTFRYEVTGVNNGVGYNLVAAVDNSTPVAFPQPAIITALMLRNLPIARATGVATITDAFGNVTRLPMRDDGRFPDAIADDGTYAAAFFYPRAGNYSARVDFSNAGNTAVQTGRGGEQSSGSNGAVPPVTPDQLVNEPFTRSQTFQFSVTGSGGFAQFPARLSNLSIRARVGAADELLVAGFVVSGATPKRILVRGAGPALSSFGVTGALADPQLELFGGNSQRVALNDDWGADAARISSAASSVGAFSFASGSRDSALLVDLAPGAYSVQLSGKGGATGVGLIEVYEVGTDQKLVNLSARARVASGDQIMIPGLTVPGNTTRTVLIRGIGPTLRTFGLETALANPSIGVYRGNELIISNDNWQDNPDLPGLIASSRSAGAFPLAAGSADAALLVTLNPGAYTIQLRGEGTSTGIALVEVYELP